MNGKVKRSNIMVTIISIIMFLLGSLIFFYPTVSNYLAKKQYKELINNYSNQYNEITEDDLSGEYEKAVAYNMSLNGEMVRDPFIPGSGYALPDNYNDVLNIAGDGIMGYVEIPKISLKIPIYHGSDKKTLEKGIGHLETSALPIGGVGNNPILTGHRGLPSAELFTRLDELKKGDIIYISVLNDYLAYKVDNTFSILPGDTEGLVAQKDKDMLTLITCTPYGVNTHRMVVQAVRTTYSKEEKENIKPVHTFRLTGSTITRIGGILLGIIILLIIFYQIKRIKKYEKKG